jgi:hypothetical protein
MKRINILYSTSLKEINFSKYVSINARYYGNTLVEAEHIDSLHVTDKIFCVGISVSFFLVKFGTHRLLVTVNVVPSSPILVTLIM